MPYPDLAAAINTSGIAKKAGWELAVAFNDPKYPIWQQADMLNISGLKASPNQDIKELELYKGDVKEYIQHASLFGSELARYLSDEHLNFHLASYKGETALFIDNLATTIYFNTLKLDSKSRARKAIETFLVPTLDDLQKAFETIDQIKYIGLVLYYGSKDFLEESELPKAEAVAFLVSHEDLEAFIKGELTDKELIDGAIIFTSDRVNSKFIRAAL